MPISPSVADTPAGEQSTASEAKIAFSAVSHQHKHSRLNIADFLYQDPTREFIFKISGDSMSHVGILDKDYVIVDKGAHPKDGDIVLIATAEGYTARQFYVKSNNEGYILQSKKASVGHQHLKEMSGQNPGHAYIEGVIKHAIHSF